jgi:hypothetical protein
MADIALVGFARKSAPAFTIIHTITQDNFDGSPWPPDSADCWTVVSRAGGFTRWRNIIPPGPQTSEMARVRADVDQQPRAPLTLLERQLRFNTDRTDGGGSNSASS